MNPEVLQAHVPKSPVASHLQTELTPVFSCQHHPSGCGRMSTFDRIWHNLMKPDLLLSLSPLPSCLSHYNSLWPRVSLFLYVPTAPPAAPTSAELSRQYKII